MRTGLDGSVVTGVIRRSGERLEQIRPAYVVGALIAAQWFTTLALALSLRHSRWLYYHGGDQVWFYTTSRLLTHGLLVPTYVGYVWSIVLLPFSMVGGPNLVNALPGILLLNVGVLMPVAMCAMYGIGTRLGGRLFGYWVLLLWLVLPLIGIKYTDTGFKQRYSELALPDSFGLTALSDFPTMVALVVAGYFCLRAVQQRGGTDAALAGVFAGVAIGIKPSSALFLAGVGLALVASRHWRGLVAFVAGIAPFVLALAFWKWRGLGYLPLFHADQGMRLAVGPLLEPVGVVNLHKYINLNWHQFSQNLGSLQEHFWSARVLEWSVLAGTIALGRRGLTPFVLFGGWFWAFVFVKGTGNLGILETGGLLHMLVPAIPAFVLMIASLPLLLPGMPRRLPGAQTEAASPQRGALVLGTTAIVLFAAVPIALAGVTSRAHSGYVTTDSGPIPVDSTLTLQARTVGARVRLAWSPQHAAGAPLFYEILRGDRAACGAAKTPYGCTTTVVLTRLNHATDAPGKGAFEYWLLVGANWINSPVAGDWYVASNPAAVNVR